MFFLVGVAVTAMLNVQSFLALTEPVPAEVLVVEGWAPDFVLAEAAVEFERGRYRRIYVTGGPIEHGGALSGYKNYAELGAAILVKIGVSISVIEAVPAPSVRRDRTYASALALRSRLHQQGTNITGINLMSVGVHSRRSQLLFQKAFDGEVRVGIIAIEDRNSYGKHWWKFSNGVRSVANELFAYIYVLLVFPFVEP